MLVSLYCAYPSLHVLVGGVLDSDQPEGLPASGKNECLKLFQTTPFAKGPSIKVMRILGVCAGHY